MCDLKKIIPLAFIMLLSIITTGQPDSIPQGQPSMASEGKIYVVMAVVITILTGLLFYLFRLDRKITKLEKGNFDN